jgi:5-hydroxyisourate hydrolase-like protein (transthyretin family)
MVSPLSKQEFEKIPGANHSAMKTVVLRFTMADRNKRYHMPVMLAPHSYSVCW